MIRKRLEICMYGESTHTGIDIDTPAVNFRGSLCQEKNMNKLNGSAYKLRTCSSSTSIRFVMTKRQR